MKILCAFALLAATIAPALAGEPIRANQAFGYQGSILTVEGMATAVRKSSLPLDGMEVALDNGALLAYVPKEYLKDFPDLAALNGHRIDVSGPIGMDEGQPEIKLTSPDQIRIVH